MSFMQRITLFLITGSLIFCHCVHKTISKKETPSVVFTWLSNTNWLVETGKVRILLDGWITRIPRPGRPDIRNPETLSVAPVVPDEAGVRRIVKTLGIKKKLDYILSGHSHFDHSFDTAVWARLTGAHVIGPKSTCLQTIAQGIPESRCTIVTGGEMFDFDGGLHVRVVRWHHSGDVSTPLGLLLQTPMELVDVPTPDPITGGLWPGILDDFPVGNCLAFLFTMDHPEKSISWFWDNSGNADTFKESKIADDAFFKENNIALNNLVITPQERSVEESLVEAMEEERLGSVHLWLGYNNSYYVEQVIPILKPKAYIPQHWGGLWSPFSEGLGYDYSNERLISLVMDGGIDFHAQNQFMDKYRLDADGVTPIPNDAVKEKLGFLDRHIQ